MTFHLQTMKTMPLGERLLRLTPAPSREPRRGRRLSVPGTRTASLSWSAYRRYVACPLQAALAAAERPDFLPAGWVFGTAFRAAVAAYYRARLTGPTMLTLPDLMAAFRRRWAEEVAGDVSGAGPLTVRYSSTDGDEAVQMDMAERVLGAFLDSRVSSEVVAVGKEFQVRLAPDVPVVCGHIDLMEVRRDADRARRLHLVAFKAATRKPSAFDLDSDRLALYAEAVRQLGLDETFGLPLALRYDVVTKTRKPEAVSVPFVADDNAVARLTEQVRQIHRGMSAGIRYPVPSWRCGGCGYAQACAAWPRCAAISLPVPDMAVAA